MTPRNRQHSSQVGSRQQDNYDLFSIFFIIFRLFVKVSNIITLIGFFYLEIKCFQCCHWIYRTTLVCCKRLNSSFHNTAKVTIRNWNFDSYKDVYPKGKYKNYIRQILFLVRQLLRVLRPVCWDVDQYFNLYCVLSWWNENLFELSNHIILATDFPT